MPSLIPSYVYSLFASMVVGTLLICAFSVSTLSIKTEAEEQQLKNVAGYVATRGCELIAAATTSNITTDFTFSISPLIGNQKYWIGLLNDSTTASVEVGYATGPMLAECHVSIPARVSASGAYASGSGVAVLRCFANGTDTYLQLFGGS